MRKNNSYSNLVIIICQLFVLFSNCASSRIMPDCGIVSRYSGKNTLSLSGKSLKQGLQSQFEAFNDSINLDSIYYIWDMYYRHSEADKNNFPIADIENIIPFARVLNNQGYTTVISKPATYESIYALSKLPVLIWIALVKHSDNKYLITDKNISLAKRSPFLKDSIPIQLHIIKSIQKTENNFHIVTNDGIILKGLATDNCNAQIHTDIAGVKAPYIQIIDFLIISTLPSIEMENHIEDWYNSLPYTFEKPNIVELR